MTGPLKTLPGFQATTSGVEKLTDQANETGSAVDMQRIRNFSIIAHIDHGKSTLADRFIQLCGGLEAREMEEQVLDSNPIERERGITIKAQSVSLQYKSRDGQTYTLNF